MLDLVYYLLTNDTDVNTATGGRITTDIRVQAQDTPAITMELLAVQDLYFNRDPKKHYVYTLDVYIFGKSIAQVDGLMKQVVNAVDRQVGSYSLATGNYYEVVNILVQNRDIDVIAEADMVQGQVTLEITA